MTNQAEVVPDPSSTSDAVKALGTLLRDGWDQREAPPRILIGGAFYLAGAVLAENGTPPV